MHEVVRRKHQTAFRRHKWEATNLNGTPGTPAWNSIPPAIQAIREAAFRATSPLEPAGALRSQMEERGLFLSSRTKAGRDLPPYYLVYFLLVDLLAFPNGSSHRRHYDNLTHSGLRS